MQAYRLWPAGPITFSETLQTWSGQQHGLELEVCNLQTVLQAYPPYAPSRSPLTSPPGLLQACRVAHIIPHPHQSSLTPSSGPSRRSVTSLRRVLPRPCAALWPRCAVRFGPAARPSSASEAEPRATRGRRRLVGRWSIETRSRVSCRYLFMVLRAAPPGRRQPT